MTTAQQLIAKGREEGIEEGMEEGIEKGIEKGIKKGIEKGERGLLLRLLAARFGPVPQEYKTLVDNGSSEDIERWGLSFAAARSLDELFGAR